MNAQIVLLTCPLKTAICIHGIRIEPVTMKKEDENLQILVKELKNLRYSETMHGSLKALSCTRVW